MINFSGWSTAAFMATLAATAAISLAVASDAPPAASSEPSSDATGSDSEPLAAPESRGEGAVGDAAGRKFELGDLTTFSGNRYRVPKDARTGGNVYVFGQNTDIEGVVGGDAIVFAQGVDVSGTVEADLIAAGSRIDVDGRVGGDARLAGGEIYIDGEVGGELIAVSGVFEIGPESVVAGPVLVAAGQVAVRGTIDGPVEIGAGQIILSGTIRGDARIEADPLIVEPTARILGNLSYMTPTEVEIPDGVVQGEILRLSSDDREQVDAGRVALEVGRGLAGLWIFIYLYMAGSGIVSGVLMWLFLGPFVGGALRRAGTATNAGISFGAGFVSVMVLIVLGVLCLCFLPLSLAILAAFGALLYFGSLIGKMALGRWILRPLIKRDVHPILGLLVGIVVLFVLGLIPFVGWIPWLVVTMIGMGASLLQIRGEPIESPAAAGAPPSMESTP